MASAETAVVAAVRLCEAEDAAVLVSLAEAALAEVPQWRGGELFARLQAVTDLTEGFARCLASPSHCCWVGAIDEVVVGAAVGTWQELASGGKLAQVPMLYVLPGARGVGVGESLIGELLGWATAQGCFGLEAQALPGDRLTKNFFESQGMVARQLTLYRGLA